MLYSNFMLIDQLGALLLPLRFRTDKTYVAAASL